MLLFMKWDYLKQYYLIYNLNKHILITLELYLESYSILII